MHLPILAPGKSEYFTACFGTEEPLQTCGPELKTKLHDPFEPFSTSYHVLVVNRVSEVTFINYFTSKSQISTTFLVRKCNDSFEGEKMWVFIQVKKIVVNYRHIFSKGGDLYFEGQTSLTSKNSKVSNDFSLHLLR